MHICIHAYLHTKHIHIYIHTCEYACTFVCVCPQKKKKDAPGVPAEEVTDPPQFQSTAPWRPRLP